MSLAAEYGPTNLDRWQHQADTSPEEIASRVPVPELDIIQAYLSMRFGGEVLKLNPIVQARLYQAEVSGVNTPPLELEPVEVNWDILLGNT